MKSPAYNSCRIVELEHAINAMRRACTNYPEGDADKIADRVMRDDEHLDRFELKHNGQDYFFTGKFGNRISDGLMCREFRSYADHRIWLYRDGSILED